MNIHRYFIAAAVALIILGAVSLRAQNRIGVALEHDSTVSIVTPAGEEVTFRLHALDDRGKTIPDWNAIGGHVTLIVTGSRAEVDSSARSWNDDPDGYSWTRVTVNDALLTIDSLTADGEAVRMFFTVPPDAFTNGYATLGFTQSAVGSGIVLSISPTWPFLLQQSPPIQVRPGKHANYLVDLTSVLPDRDAVYWYRKFELVVIPRDRYLNPCEDILVETVCRERFHGELDILPYEPNIHDGPILVSGATSVFLLYRIVRPDASDPSRQELPWFEVHAASDTSIHGRSDAFSVLDHAPYPFRELTPLTGSTLKMRRRTDLVFFTWERPEPPDPCTAIHLSRFDSLDRVWTDEIRYRVCFCDASNPGRCLAIDSDQGGRLPRLTRAHQHLVNLAYEVTGFSRRYTDILWFVIATDGLYSQSSSPRDSTDTWFRFTIENNWMPYDPGFVLGTSAPSTSALELSQNYPNPFNPSTTIPLTLESAERIRVRVFNILGEEIAILHDGFLAPGTHHLRFDGAGLPTGVYRYVLETDGRTESRGMLLR